MILTYESPRRRVQFVTGHSALLGDEDDEIALGGEFDVADDDEIEAPVFGFAPVGA